jgi:hypothetical protein
MDYISGLYHSRGSNRPAMSDFVLPTILLHYSLHFCTKLTYLGVFHYVHEVMATTITSHFSGFLLFSCKSHLLRRYWGNIPTLNGCPSPRLWWALRWGCTALSLYMEGRGRLPCVATNLRQGLKPNWNRTRAWVGLLRATPTQNSCQQLTELFAPPPPPPGICCKKTWTLPFQS